MSTEYKAFNLALWIVAILFAGYQGYSLYYQLMPAEHWVEYHDISPIAKQFNAGHSAFMISTVTVNNPSSIRFNDILFCRSPMTGSWSRYSDQSTVRLHSTEGSKRPTEWTYSPLPPYDTECYIESNIVLYVGNHVRKSFRYDGLEHGKTFRVVQ